MQLNTSIRSTSYLPASAIVLSDSSFSGFVDKGVWFLARREGNETYQRSNSRIVLRTASACSCGECLRQSRQIYCLYMLSALPELCRHACCKDTLGVYLIDVTYVKYTFCNYVNSLITFAPRSPEHETDWINPTDHQSIPIRMDLDWV